MISTIVPTPKKIEIFEGVTCLSPALSSRHAPWAHHLNLLADCLCRIFGCPFQKAEGGITLAYDASLAPKSYRLDSREGLLLSASDEEGLFYGLASVLQAIDQKDGQFTAEKALVEDYPDKDYRSLMVDLSREWHPADKIFRYIDVCFFLKVKYLHLHFIDDQRYSLPSKVFPEISTKGEHYTFEEIAAFRAYANDRGITLIPEFEAPGHAGSLNKNYPDVFANTISGSAAELVTEEGLVITAKNLVCAGSEKAMDGIRALLTEICEMFPETPYIHIGGDEANIKAWNDCSVCRDYMAQNGIEDEYELYSDFIGRVAQMVLDLGRTPIVWEGFPKKGAERVPKETIVCAWESHYHMAYELLEEGFPIINGSWQPLYIVPGGRLRWGIPEIMNWGVYDWEHWWEHSEATLNPIHLAPTDQVLGAQLSSWECTYEQEINFIMENLAALSERTWSVRRYWEGVAFIRRYRNAKQKLARLIQDR